mgnify:CR=1 FL=1
MNKIDVYEYIATNNPRASMQILRDFGYDVLNRQSMSQNLRDLVNKEGDSAIHEIMKYHPDRDYFSESVVATKIAKIKKKFESEKEKYLNASGSNQNSNSIVHNLNSANTTNVIILASAIVIAIAITSKK